MPYERAAGGYMAARKASKKVINFFVVGLTYGCLKSCNRMRLTPVAFMPLTISCSINDFVNRNILSLSVIPYSILQYSFSSSAKNRGIVIFRLLLGVLGGVIMSLPFIR